MINPYLFLLIHHHTLSKWYDIEFTPFNSTQKWIATCHTTPKNTDSNIKANQKLLSILKGCNI